MDVSTHSRSCPECMTMKTDSRDGRCPCGYAFSNKEDTLGLPSPNTGPFLTSAIQDLIKKTRTESDFGEAARGIGSIPNERENIDLNDYKPIQAFPLNERPCRILTINHELAKNIIGVQFEHRVAIFLLERKKEGDEEFFTCMKIQEFSSPTQPISAFSINSASNVSPFGEPQLGYGLSFVNESKLYVVSESKRNFARVKTMGSTGVTVLDGHRAAVRHMAFDAERGELLASLSDDAICIVWAVESQKQIARLCLQSPGIACLWHKAEPYKLLIVEQSGVIRMYNTLKEKSSFTINTLVAPIFAADWSPSDSLLVGIGVNKAAVIFDLSLLNSEPGKRIETHFGPTHVFKFCTTDSQQFATASHNPRAEIRTFQKNLRNYIWSKNHEVECSRYCMDLWRTFSGGARWEATSPIRINPTVALAYELND